MKENTSMNRLEQKIYDALLRYEDAKESDIMTQSICKGHAQVAAKICLEVAEKSWNDSLMKSDDLDYIFEDFKQEICG